MTKVLEKTVDDEVVVAHKGLTCAMGYGVAIDGEAPAIVMFYPGEPTKTKRKYADFLVKCDREKFSVVESVVEEAAKTEPRADVPEKVDEEKQPEPKGKGFFKK